MAAIDTVATFGRISVFGDVSVILFSIDANGATYTTASGGLPIDLTAPLTQGAPFSQPYLNPADIVGIMQIAVPSTTVAGYYPYNLVVGTPTYTNPAVWPFAGGSAGSIQPDQQLATCPATIRLYDKAGTELANGATTAVFTVALIVARGGTNN